MKNDRKNSLLKIDSKNSTEFYDDIIIFNLKYNLYQFLSEYTSNNDYISTYHTFLNALIPNWNKDFFKLSCNISSNLKDKLKHEKYFYKDSKSGLQKILDRNYFDEFYFFYSHIEELSIFICKNYLTINRNKITNNDDFVSSYKLSKGDFSKSIISIDSTPAIFPFYFKSSSMKNTNDIFNFPQDFTLITDKFTTIKTLKVFLPNVLENTAHVIDIYSLLLVNMPWIFSEITEVELELEASLYNNLSNVTKEEYLKENSVKFSLMLLIPYYLCKIKSMKSLILKLPESFEQDINFHFQQILYNNNNNNNTNNHNIINTINSNNTNNYNNKHSSNVTVFENFHVLDVFKKYIHLEKLEVEFNSLDSNTFKRILSIIHLNNDIKHLKLVLFPQNEEFLTKHSLKRINKINKSCKLIKISDRRMSESLFGEIDDDIEYIMNSLVENFQINMEYLLLLLMSKFNFLKGITVFLSLPFIVESFDKYINIFHKFLFNLFSLISGKNNLKSIIITSTNFSIDSRKYEVIRKLFNEIDLSQKELIKTFTFKAKLNKIVFTDAFFPPHLQNLTLGEFDINSFESFLKIYEKEVNNSNTNSNINSNKFKGLINITIHLSKFHFGDEYIETLIYLLALQRPKLMESISVFSELKINLNQINEIISLMKNEKDKIKSYYLQFSKKSINDDIVNVVNELKLDKCYYYERNIKKIYNLMWIYKVKRMKVNSKRNKDSKENKDSKYSKDMKIFKTISNFLKEKKEKTVEIRFV